MATASSQSVRSTNVNNVQSRIECPVCLEIFRTPKSLTCGHSVCAGCCQNLVSGNSITCPVCRRPTIVPASGLPTNFALQDVIQLLQNREDRKRYRCVECDRPCAADEACISIIDENPTPVCFRCVIAQQRALSDNEVTLPAAMESVADAFKRHGDELPKLRRRMETFYIQQQNLTSEGRGAIWPMIAATNALMEGSRSVAATAMESAEKLDKEYQLLQVRANSVNAPRSLEDLGDFKNSIEDVTSKLDHSVKAQQNTLAFVRAAQNLANSGYRDWNDLLTNYQKNQNNDETPPRIVESSVTSPPGTTQFGRGRGRGRGLWRRGQK